MSPQHPSSADLPRRLHEELAARRARNPSYSLRAFARALDLGSSALSEILNGKRRVSTRVLERLAKKLCWEPETTQQLMTQTLRASRRPAAPRQSYYTPLDADAFRVTAEWEAFAILSLTETEGFRSDPSWIARRLGISLAKTKSTIERLERLKMLVRDGDDGLRPTGVQYATTDDIANLSVRKSHFENLELAKTSLERDALEARDFTALTFTLDPDRLPEAKRALRRFRDQFGARMESGRKHEVYKLCLQLFPLSRKEDL